ncbi:MAG: DUF5615 family PIN-like protein [Chloroflexota bacterium]
MRLLVDEDLRSSELMARLRKAGHQLEMLPTGTEDKDIWPYAQDQKLILLTGNPDDFKAQAARTLRHHGLLIVHGEHEQHKNMSDAEIAAAIGYVHEVYGGTLPPGTQINLNEWRRPQATRTRKRATPPL